MKIVVVTTSYPTPQHPVAGNFVASAVEAVRAAAPFPPIPQEVLGETTRLGLRLPIEYQQPRRP